MRKLITSLGIVCLIAAAFACRADLTPMAVVPHTREAALALGLAAAALFALSARLAIGKRRMAWIGLALSIATIGFAARLLWFTDREETVDFASAGVTLRGTLYLPRAQPPYPAIVFVHGAGAETRREFAPQARLFARHGIAALTYDKRGAGASEGSTWETDYAGYAQDAAAAFRLLAARPEVDVRRLGVFGHSEGGWVAPLVAAEIPDLAFVIVTSTTHLTPARQVLYQTGEDVRATGASEAEVRRAQELQRRVLHYQRTGEGRDGLARDLPLASRQSWFEAADLPPEPYPLSEYTWWRSVMDYDPVPHWKRVRAPVLMVSGGLDRNSDVRESQARLRAALAAGGNTRFTGRIYPDMEHGTIEWWLPGRMPPPRFPAGYPELLVSWIWEQIG